MPYLLDTNTLIQAKNEYYAFSLCPGFWDWIDLQTTTGVVFSIEPVLKEIRDVADELKDWADSRSLSLFRAVDAETMTKFVEVVTLVQQGDFKDEAKRDFLARADPLLIAYAMAHPGTLLATHEVHIEGERKKVKIPTVCRALGVSCIRTFGMLSRENASFVLPS